MVRSVTRATLRHTTLRQDLAELLVRTAEAGRAPHEGHVLPGPGICCQRARHNDSRPRHHSSSSSPSASSSPSPSSASLPEPSPASAAPSEPADGEPLPAAASLGAAPSSPPHPASADGASPAASAAVAALRRAAASFLEPRSAAARWRCGPHCVVGRRGAPATAAPRPSPSHIQRPPGLARPPPRDRAQPARQRRQARTLPCAWTPSPYRKHCAKDARNHARKQGPGGTTRVPAGTRRRRFKQGRQASLGREHVKVHGRRPDDRGSRLGRETGTLCRGDPLDSGHDAGRWEQLTGGRGRRCWGMLSCSGGRAHPRARRAMPAGGWSPNETAYGELTAAAAPLCQPAQHREEQQGLC